MAIQYDSENSPDGEWPKLNEIGCNVSTVHGEVALTIRRNDLWMRIFMTADQAEDMADHFGRAAIAATIYENREREDRDGLPYGTI